MAGDTGLVSLGAFGSIMVWPRAELQGTLSNAGLLASARYCFCHMSGSTSDYSVSHPHFNSVGMTYCTASTVLCGPFTFQVMVPL